METKKANEWIKWDGNKCPVDENTLVDVRIRCYAGVRTGLAKDFIWDHASELNSVYYQLRVSRYRVNPEQPKWIYDLLRGGRGLR